MIFKLPFISRLAFLAGFFFLDQALKHTLPNTFLNTGSVFSLPIPNWLLILLATLTIFPLSQIWERGLRGEGWGKLGLQVLITGGISNLLDRLTQGGVIDYIHIKNTHLNLADIYILVGILVIASDLLPAPWIGRRLGDEGLKP